MLTKHLDSKFKTKTGGKEHSKPKTHYYQDLHLLSTYEKENREAIWRLMDRTGQYLFTR
jgi:hypothetical protein